MKKPILTLLLILAALPAVVSAADLSTWPATFQNNSLITPSMLNELRDSVNSKADRSEVAFGAWAESTSYAQYDIAANMGVLYACTVAHASTVLNEPGIGGVWETVWSVATGTADADLDAIATLSTLPWGRDLLTLSDASAARAILGLVIGTDVLSPTGDGSNLTGITVVETDPEFTAKEAGYDAHTIDTDLHIATGLPDGLWRIGIPKNTVPITFSQTAGYGDLFLNANEELMIWKPGDAAPIKVGSDLTLDDILDGVARVLGAGSGGYVAIPDYSDSPCLLGQWSLDLTTTPKRRYLCIATDSWDYEEITLAGWGSPAPVSGLLLDDNFTNDASTVDITAHTATPGPGGAWLYKSGSAETLSVSADEDALITDATGAYAVNNTADFASGVVSAFVKIGNSSSTQGAWVYIRAAQASANSYNGRLYGDKRIEIRENSTVIATDTCSAITSTTLDTIEIRLTASGTALTFEVYDGATQLCTLSANDDTLTTGKSGLGMTGIYPRIYSITANGS